MKSKLIQTGILKFSEVVYILIKSIERLHHYAENLERESAYVNESNRPPISWPHEGSIDVKNLEIRYSESGPAVIKGIDFNIKPKEKIGVVGRTGMFYFFL